MALATSLQARLHPPCPSSSLPASSSPSRPSSTIAVPPALPSLLELTVHSQKPGRRPLTGCSSCSCSTQTLFDGLGHHDYSSVIRDEELDQQLSSKAGTLPAIGRACTGSQRYGDFDSFSDYKTSENQNPSKRCYSSTDIEHAGESNGKIVVQNAGFKKTDLPLIPNGDNTSSQMAVMIEGAAHNGAFARASPHDFLLKQLDVAGEQILQLEGANNLRMEDKQQELKRKRFDSADEEANMEQSQKEFRNETKGSGMINGSWPPDQRRKEVYTSDEEMDLPDEDEAIEPITKIPVTKQKYIPIPKAKLVKSLADAFQDDQKASEFLTICSFLDCILHAEHKTILEQLRLDYKITRSALKKQAEDLKGDHRSNTRGRKSNGWLRKVAKAWRRQREQKVSKYVSGSVKEEVTSFIGDQLVNGHSKGRIASPPVIEGESPAAPKHRSENGTPGSTSTNSRDLSSETNRNSILAAARFQRNFLKLLRNAQFQGLSARDLQLTSALNTDYILTLPIDVDWKRASLENAIIFRRGYSAERQEGFLFGAKLDYIQSRILRKAFSWFSKPLFRTGTWINQQWKYTTEKNGSNSWAEGIKEWLKEPLKPDMDDDLSGVIAEAFYEQEKEGDLPIWTVAQQAVPRYEAFLSSVGSRGLLLRRILVWMRILPPKPANLPANFDQGSSASEPHLRGSYLTRISMRDIWLPASKVVCGGNALRRLQAAFKIFFSRSTLQTLIMNILEQSVTIGTHLHDAEYIQNRANYLKSSNTSMNPTRDSKGSYKVWTIMEPAFKELVLLYNVPNTVEIDDEREIIPNLNLKIYGKIPIPDLKVIFPNKKLSFRILDAVRLDFATIIGLLAFLVNYRFDDFLSSPSAFLLDIIATSALIVYITRVFLGYKQTFDRYQLLVNKTLYEKTLASGFGAVHFLVDASEQQQFKEAALAFALLMRAKGREVESQKALAAKCERFLFNQFKEQVEMPIDDALTTLSRLGLVTLGTPSVSEADQHSRVSEIQALPHEQLLSTLRDRWQKLLHDQSMWMDFIKSLQNSKIM